jgi:peptidoglycan/xylan/chitin deacetylase (PgdA/CDA1 family)
MAGVKEFLRDAWGRSAQAVEKMLPRHLTVLCYHRIDETVYPELYGYWPNVSASPVTFQSQMAYLQRHYNFVHLDDVQRYLRGDRDLPKRPVLVTFDDGYRDNLTTAAPILAAFGISAVFFIATDYIGGALSFPPDYASNAVLTSQKQGKVTLPLVGEVDLAGDRRLIIRPLVQKLKRLTTAETVAVFQDLAAALAVPTWGRAPPGVQMNADDLRALQSKGHVIAAHTESHCNIGAVSLEQARVEFQGSRRILAEILGQPVTSFAFPYGGARDYTRQAEAELRDQGFSSGFAANGGFAFLRELRRRPHAIRRIMIGVNDRGPRFAAKLALEARWRGR